MNDEPAMDRPGAEREEAAASTTSAPGASGARADEASRATGAPRACPRCGAELTPGQLALPLLGAPKFGVRLGTLSVEVDVAAALCLDCGFVDLWVPDTGRIRKAIRAEHLVSERARKRSIR